MNGIIYHVTFWIGFFLSLPNSRDIQFIQAVASINLQFVLFIDEQYFMIWIFVCLFTICSLKDIWAVSNLRLLLIKLL